MAHYTIAGTTYASEREVIDTYGAADYSLVDWQDVLNAGEPACREGNRQAFPELSGADIDELTAATMVYADAVVSQARREGMTTYTVQQHRHSGDVHALRWEGDTITGISEALHWQAVEMVTADGLPHLDYEPYQGSPDGIGDDGEVAWHPPTISTNIA